MNENSTGQDTGRKKPLWVAIGFLVAFATSVFTVIYTGLKPEGERAVFDTGFRAVTLAPGERRAIELVFDSDAAYSEATLVITLPAMAELVPAGE